MQPIELMITSSVQDRVDVAAILIKNGYRVCQKVVKANGKSKTVLVVDREYDAKRQKKKGVLWACTIP